MGQRAPRSALLALLWAASLALLVPAGSVLAQTAGGSEDISLAKNHHGNLTAGSLATFMLTVRNVGSTVIDFGDARVVDELPPEFSYHSASGSGWSFWMSAGRRFEIHATYDARLSPGETASFNVTVTVLPSASGIVSNTAYCYTDNDRNAANAHVSDPASVFAGSSGSNPPPVANAGANRIVGAGSTVQLDGSQSRDPNGDRLVFQWSQMAGPQVEIVSANSARASFVAPPATYPGLIAMQLTVSDGVSASVSSVFVDVLPCTFSFTPTSQSFSAAGGSGYVSITGGELCSWRAQSNTGWIILGSARQGYGNGRVEYTVLPNPGDGERTGSLTINGENFQVTQRGRASSLTFAQVAVGGGYSSTFILANTGAEPFVGTLAATAGSGAPFRIKLTRADDRPTSEVNSTFALAIPPGGSQFFLAEPADSSAGTTSGWASVQGTGGPLTGAVVFKWSDKGKLLTAAGVMPALQAQHATMPVTIDADQEQFTGFAIANTGPADAAVSITVLDEAGKVVAALSPSVLNPLRSGNQTAIFLHQLLPPTPKLRGSAVISVEEGKKAVVVGLVQKQGLLSTIPVIPAKAPTVPE